MQPLYEHLSGEGVSKKNEQVTLTEMGWVPSILSGKHALRPSAGFAGFNKPFLLETDTRKLGLGAMLLQKQTNG